MTRSRDTGNVGYRAYKKNLLINGGFDIWQRGNVVVSSGGGIFYWADRFFARSVTQTGGNTTLSKLFLGPPDNEHYAKLTVSGHTGGMYLGQRIEASAFEGRGGKDFTFTVNTLDMDATVDWGMNVSVFDGTTTETVHTAVPRPLSTGSTFEETFTFNTTLSLESPNAFVAITLTADDPLPDGGYRFWRMQLEEGTTATPFEYRPIGEELALCQRYYETGKIAISSTMNAGDLGASDAFVVPKRTTPTMVYSNESAVGVNTSPNNWFLDNRVYSVYHVRATAAESRVNFIDNWTADAEL